MHRWSDTRSREMLSQQWSKMSSDVNLQMSIFSRSTDDDTIVRVIHCHCVHCSCHPATGGHNPTIGVHNTTTDSHPTIAAVVHLVTVYPAACFSISRKVFKVVFPWHYPIVQFHQCVFVLQKEPNKPITNYFYNSSPQHDRIRGKHDVHSFRQYV